MVLITCVCVCVFVWVIFLVNLHITAQFSPVIPVTLCLSHSSSHEGIDDTYYKNLC